MDLAAGDGSVTGQAKVVRGGAGERWQTCYLPPQQTRESKCVCISGTSVE